MNEARVVVGGEIVGSIQRGFAVLVGVEPGDSAREVERVVDKLVTLRVFPDELGKMNLSLGDVSGEVLVVSQFTLLADVRKGRRPSFAGAAAPEHAEKIVLALVDELRDAGVVTASGVFGAHMEVSLTNQGPVTIVLDVRDGRIL